MRPLLLILSTGILCAVVSCKQEQKETNPFNESICAAIQKKEKTTGITDLTDSGQTRSLVLCEEELLKDGISVKGAYGNYWKETHNPNVDQITVNNFFTFSHKVFPDITEEGQAKWQGFTLSNVYYPGSHKTNETTDSNWGTLAGGGLINPHIPFPLEPKVPMIEGAIGAPFMMGRWNNGNEISIETINKKFNEKDFSCWIKLGQKEEYTPRGMYICLSSLPASDISEKTLVIRGVDGEGKFSRATIKTPLIAPGGDADSKNKWRWIDMSRLGKSQYLVFQIGNTQEGKVDSIPIGYYFCIDGLTAEK